MFQNKMTFDPKVFERGIAIKVTMNSNTKNHKYDRLQGKFLKREFMSSKYSANALVLDCDPLKLTVSYVINNTEHEDGKHSDTVIPIEAISEGVVTIQMLEPVEYEEEEE